ncbi:MAG: tetratricopeptide repeat protein [Polyangiaceae bacterium]
MRLWPCLALIAITSYGTASHAQSDDQNSDALIDAGVALREQGRDDLALQDFQKAYALTPTSHALAQIGLAEQALGIWLKAEHDVTEALKDASDPWIEKNRNALASALSTIQSHLGTLEIRCDAPDAEVFVDGGSRGKLNPGSSIRVEAGTREVQVRAPGKYASSRSVIVPPGGIARETIALESIPATVANDKRDLGVGDSTSYLRRGDPPNTQRNISLAMLGTSAALIITGFVGIGAREVEVNSYNDDPSCPGRAGSGQPPLCQSKIDTAQTWTTISIVGFVSAGALVAGGAVLLLTAPRASADLAPSTNQKSGKTRKNKAFIDDLACAPGLGIVCSGRF